MRNPPTKRFPLIEELKNALRRHADPTKAAPMQAYMKSEMPYHGVQAPQLRAICREVFPRHPLPDFHRWSETVLALWRTARCREERYAAITLTGLKEYARFRTMEALPIYEEMIVDGAWWDLVDGIAGDRLGELLSRYPARMKKLMRHWSRDPVMWKRRSAILCQLGFKERTDLALLYDCLEPNLADQEFFIRKAIGWALRQYAWTDPTEVRRYVVEQGGRLSALSRREALKNIGEPPKKQPAVPRTRRGTPPPAAGQTGRIRK